MRRCLLAILTLAVVVCCWVPACSETTKHRVMSFFLDGVPQPGQRPESAKGSGTPPPGTSLEGAPAAASPPTRYYSHTPYRDGRCAGCHSADTGQLIKTAEQGLCLLCHGGLAGDKRYIHGPVAVHACTECHHYHTAPFPQLLLKDPTATCLQCHERADLSPTEYHLLTGGPTCAECHDPHGSDDRFFLKRAGP